MSRHRVAIIGAGVGGMASAIRLAHKGYEVHVFEAQQTPGGKLSQLQLGPYRFDAGPSLCTLPGLIEELFTLTGRRPADYIQFQPLTVACRYFWPDGTTLTGWQNPEALAQEVALKLGVSAPRLQRALDHSRRLFELSGKVFLENSLHRLRTYLRPEILRALISFPLRDLFLTMDTVNRARLQHPKLVQYFNRFATYNGSSPYQAPGVLSLIPHLEHGIGAVSPVGGMYRITEALYRLGCELGVSYHFGQPVERILRSGRQVSGVQVGGAAFAARYVVSNMDVVPTYRRLMPEAAYPRRTLAQERSSSALIFYWGIRSNFPQLDLHNIFFSADYAREFREIFQEKTLPQDPTVYVNIGSRYVPEDAPRGCENWFVMLNVPADHGQDWQTLRIEARMRILRRLHDALGRDIEPLIAVEEVLTPPMLEQRTSSWQGALYGTSSNSRFAAFLRHPNFSRRYRGLYFCGGSVHPGGGIPLCLYSARLVDSLIPPPW